MERYEIIIQDRRTKKPTNVSGEDTKKKRTNVSGEDEDDKDEKDKKISVKMIAKAAISEARSLIVSNIGEYSRNSLLQQNIDATLSLAETISSFAIHPVYGLYNMASKTASNAIQYAFQNQKEQHRLQEALQRASYVNRSRE